MPAGAALGNMANAWWCQIPLEQALDALKDLLADPGVLKIGQNIKYDQLVLARHGTYLRRWAAAARRLATQPPPPNGLGGSGRAGVEPFAAGKFDLWQP